MIHRIVRIVCVIARVIARVFHGRARAVPGTKRAHAAIGLFRHPRHRTGIHTDAKSTHTALTLSRACVVAWSMEHAAQYNFMLTSVNLDAFDTTIVSQSVISRPITDIQLTYDRCSFLSMYLLLRFVRRSCRR